MEDPNNIKALMLGLDSVGKTTLLYKMKLDELVSTIPTIGFNMETIPYKGASIAMWDIGGQGKIRPLWGHYYDGAKVLVYVVDSSDAGRFAEARTELTNFLSAVPGPKIPLLVLANKQDLPHARSVAEVAEALGLNLLTGRTWYITAVSALSGAGTKEALEWIVKETIGEAKPVPKTGHPSREHMISQLQAINKVVKYHGKLVTELTKVLEAGSKAKVRIEADGSVSVE